MQKNRYEEYTCWSSYVIEYVESLEKSKQFIKNMLNVLKLCGLEVQTTNII